MGEMYTNLMRASGVQCKPDAGEETLVALLNSGIGDGLFAGCNHSHLLPMMGIAPDGQLNSLLPPVRNATAPGQILAIDIMGREELDELLVRSFRLCNNNASRCLLVETVDDTGTLYAIDARKGGTVMQQGMNQCPVIMAVARMYHHARRLVDNDQIFIFKEDVERDILSNKFQWLAIRNVNGVILTRQNLERGFERGMRAEDGILIQQLFDPGA